MIDSTDPDAVRRVLDATDPARTFHVASSKSGTTLETRSHLDLFWERSGDPDRFAVITDPGSALGELARARGFRHVFENNPDIGGRYAALSLFGMVPAALIDADGDAILEAALDMADALEPLGDGDDADGNIGLRLGAAFGAAARAGRDQLTIVLTPALESFGLWLEQLVAESTGKHGDGIIPIVGEPIPDVCATPDRRLLVTIGDVEGIAELRASGAPLIELSLEELHDVGAQVLLWEVAVALAGKVLGINPFDQPDVEAAKAAARELLDADAPPAPPVTPLADAPAKLFSTVGGDPAINGEYVFLAILPDTPMDEPKVYKIGDFNSWSLESQSAGQAVVKVSRSWIDGNGDIKTADERYIVSVPPWSADELTVTPAK